MWSNSEVNASPYNVPHMVRFSEGTSKPLEIHRVCMSQPRQNPLLCFPLCCAGCSANYDLKQILVCFLNLLVNTCCVQLIFPGTFSLVLRKERWTSVALWGTRRLHCFLQERMLCSYLRIGAGGLVWLLCIRQKRLWCLVPRVWGQAHMLEAHLTLYSTPTCSTTFILPWIKYLRDLETQAVAFRALTPSQHVELSCPKPSAAVWECHSLPEQSAGVGRGDPFSLCHKMMGSCLCQLQQILLSNPAACRAQHSTETSLHQEHTWWKIHNAFLGKQQETLL